ncbi:MAG: hypothetical protein K6T16_01985 [Candidatus Pacearchaeota archaeon]|nr:hypothetical protein [Candidatus Pacearchaeota archaeon]
MPQNCPWCGRTLELKVFDLGSTLKQVCGRCGFKIKEIEKPAQPKVEPKPEVVEVKQAEIPVAKQAPAWPFILGAIVLIIIIIALVKIFLV